MTSAHKDSGISQRARSLRVHMFAFAGVSVALFAADLMFFETRWSHWPIMAWGAFFCVHALYCKSLSVDEHWAEERADKVRAKSYDLGHILDIERSYNKDPSPDDPAAEDRK